MDSGYDTPIEWVNTEGMNYNEEFVGESFGRINKAEAALSISQLTHYINKIGKRTFFGRTVDVGLISPIKHKLQYLPPTDKTGCIFQALPTPHHHQFW